MDRCTRALISEHAQYIPCAPRRYGYGYGLHPASCVMIREQQQVSIVLLAVLYPIVENPEP